MGIARGATKAHVYKKTRGSRAQQAQTGEHPKAHNESLYKRLLGTFTEWNTNRPQEDHTAGNPAAGLSLRSRGAHTAHVRAVYCGFPGLGGQDDTRRLLVVDVGTGLHPEAGQSRGESGETF